MGLRRRARIILFAMDSPRVPVAPVFFERLLLAEAGLSLVAAKLVVACAPFRWYGRGFVQIEACPAPRVPAPNRAIARQVGWAISAAANRLPFACSCLVKSLGGRAMMRRRGLPSTLRLGVALNSADLSAHAWLESGDVTITGRKEAARHHEVARLK
jgi:hypothetical protein